MAASKSTQVLVFALAFVLVSAVGGAQATHGGNGQPISGQSEFRSPTCSPPAVDKNAYDMEFQPHLAVNPTDPNNIAVAWTQDATSGIVVGVTRDGGDTWTKSVPPMTSVCSGGAHTTADHAHVSFGPEGRLYLSTWNTVTTARERTRVTVQVSPDGGETWSDPVTLEETTSADQRFLEWSWVVADPTRPGTAYATWMSRDLARPSDPINALNDAEMRFARTTNGGETWSAPRDISPAGPDYDRYDRYLPELVVLPDGSLVNMYFQFPKCSIDAPFPCPPETASVKTARSTDGGENWSAPAEVVLRKNVYGYSEDSRVRQLGHGPSAHPPLSLPAVSGDGTIYYTWVEYRCQTQTPNCSSSSKPDFASKLYLTSSTDGGATWARPRVIRESAVPMANPNVAVAPGDNVGVLFYDFRNDDLDDDPENDCRNDPDDEKAETDVWFINAPNAARGLESWKERHVAGPFDVCSLPVHAGINQGIAAIPGAFVSAYTVGLEPPSASNAGPTDIFFSRFRP